MRRGGIKGYSGVATYRNPSTFRRRRRRISRCSWTWVWSRKWRGCEINGRNLGVAWCPPWRVAIPAGLLQARGNQLVITVANTWNNRLCADAALPENERLTVVGHDLHQWAAKAGFQPSGLLGPVRVLTMERQ